MTTPQPPSLAIEPRPEGLAILRAHGLRLDAPLELELLTREPSLVVGKLVDATISAGRLSALVVEHTGGAARSLVPWHAVARVLTRPDHPANT